MQQRQKQVFGYVIIFLGVGLLLQELGLIRSFGAIIGKLWPGLLLVWGWRESQKGNYRRAFGLVVLGVIFLVSVWMGLGVWQLVWPILLILAGVSLLRKKSLKAEAAETEMPGDYIDKTVAFDVWKAKVASAAFRGGEVKCLFGGTEIDLGEVKLAQDQARLEVVAFFGSIDIRVPKGVRVETDAHTVGGKWDEFLKPGKGKKQLLITGVAGFGSVTIRDASQP